MTLGRLPSVIGHRGAKGHAPENTIAGFRKAAELGASWVEFDVKLTADDALVLMHDDTLNRTTDGKGPVASQTLAELKRLDAGKWFSADFAGEAIPTLDEALEVLAERGMGANVEIKPCPGRDRETGGAVAYALAQRWAGGRVPLLISSFSASALSAAREAAPGIPRGFLVERMPGNWREQLDELRCIALHAYDPELGPARIGAIRNAGYRVLTYTVNNASRARALLSWGVESIITDYPDRISKG